MVREDGWSSNSTHKLRSPNFVGMSDQKRAVVVRALTVALEMIGPMPGTPLVPKQISTSDRTILGKISKRGNRYLRAG